MRVAIVNNSGIPLENILNLIQSDAEVFGWQSVSLLDTQNFDLLILSGSSQFPIEYNREKLEGEIELIQKSTIPTIGICYGCELIAVAFGGKLKDRGEGTQERKPVLIKVREEHPIFQGQKEFMAYDAHRWVIDTLPDDLEILAESVHGPEVIRHKNRPIYGFQFPPEKMLNETLGDELFNEFIKLYVGSPRGQWG